MNLAGHPFSTIDWSGLETTVHAGESGEALWRTVEIGDVRLRMVEYTPGYLADHWCTRGHVLLVLDGELRTELGDGRVSVLTAGQSYQIGTDMEPHRSSTSTGARLFVVD